MSYLCWFVSILLAMMDYVQSILFGLFVMLFVIDGNFHVIIKHILKMPDV